MLSLSKSVSADDDGLLTASEASQLSIGAEWVILSACNMASAEGSADSLSALSRDPDVSQRATVAALVATAAALGEITG